MPYWLWVPSVVVYFSVAAILTKRINDHYSTGLFWLLYFLPVMWNPWPFVAKTSRTIVFDGFLHDFLALISFYATMFVLGAGTAFTWKQQLACIGMVICMVVLRMEK